MTDPGEGGGGLQPSPIRAGEWTTPDGVHWRRRGARGDMDVKRAEKLLRAPDTRVLHVYGPTTPIEVAPLQREAFWARVRPCVTGRIREPGDFTDFVVAEEFC